jgi:hypothetical protein
MESAIEDLRTYIGEIKDCVTALAEPFWGDAETLSGLDQLDDGWKNLQISEQSKMLYNVPIERLFQDWHKLEHILATEFNPFHAEYNDGSDVYYLLISIVTWRIDQIGESLEYAFDCIEHLINDHPRCFSEEEYDELMGYLSIIRRGVKEYNANSNDDGACCFDEEDVLDLRTSLIERGFEKVVHHSQKRQRID